MDNNPRHLIIDDTGVLWSSDSYDAFEEGSSIMAAVDEGKKKKYEPHIGSTWSGDLVLVQELARAREFTETAGELGSLLFFRSRWQFRVTAGRQACHSAM